MRVKKKYIYYYIILYKLGKSSQTINFINNYLSILRPTAQLHLPLFR
jgi:hypothetical protein